MQNEKRTLVEEGTELKGTLKSSCPVVVNGAIDGQIEAPALTVTKSGTVLGSVKAKELRSDGTLAGDIDAENVYLSGTVRSNTVLRAKTLEVKLAPEKGKLEITFGECLLEVGEEPASAPAIGGSNIPRAPDAPEESSNGAMASAEADAGKVPGAEGGAVPAVDGALSNASADGAEVSPSDDAAGAALGEDEGAEGRSNRKKRQSNRHSQPPP